QRSRDPRHRTALHRGDRPRQAPVADALERTGRHAGDYPRPRPRRPGVIAPSSRGHTCFRRTAPMTSIPALSRPILLALFAALGRPALADDADPPFTREESYLAAHPSLFWLQEGVRAYERGRFRQAMTALRRSARHADKTAQAMISQ